MRFGVCCGYDRWELLKDAGYDYAEGNLTSVAMADDARLDAMMKARENAKIDVESFNCFFPGDIQLMSGDDEAVLETVRNYTERAFKRAALLGGRIAVLGSSRSRTVPEGTDIEWAKERFARVLKICAEAGRKHGIKTVIEPLSRTEVNFINTVLEGAEMCKRVSDPQIGTLIDFYHFFKNEEPISSIKELPPHLMHAHIARANADRRPPSDEDMDDVLIWSKALKEIGYNERISVEASIPGDFLEAIARTRKTLRAFES